MHPPLGNYSHTVNVPPGASWLVISGQVGADKNGKVARGVERQTERAFRNIVAALKASGMDKQDLVKVTVYLTDSRFVDEFRRGRDKVLGDMVGPASTLLVVNGLAGPDLLVEVEATAAKTAA
jgi:2-iminobutanoate/2-iminopropanoate deaminase